jgi:hypothetical protein
MTVRIQCRCGTVQGEIEPSGVYARLTCYCRDCQAWARWLGGPGLVDDRGGSDVLAVVPARMRFTRGLEQLRCATFSGRVLRWYAACCRSPLANTAADPKVQYAGVLATAVVSPAEVQALAGPPGRVVANHKSATGPVRATPLALAGAVVQVGSRIIGGRLRGVRRSPFFDDAGQPLRVPERISPPPAAEAAR